MNVSFLDVKVGLSSAGGNDGGQSSGTSSA